MSEGDSFGVWLRRFAICVAPLPKFRAQFVDVDGLGQVPPALDERPA